MSVSCCCCCCRCRRRCLTVVLIACPPLLYRFLHCGKSLWRMDESRWMAMEEVHTHTHTVYIDVCGVHVPAWNIWASKTTGARATQREIRWAGDRGGYQQQQPHGKKKKSETIAWIWRTSLLLHLFWRPAFEIGRIFFLEKTSKQQLLGSVAAVVASLLSPNRETVGVL